MLLSSTKMLYLKPDCHERCSWKPKKRKKDTWNENSSSIFFSHVSFKFIARTQKFLSGNKYGLKLFYNYYGLMKKPAQRVDILFLSITFSEREHASIFIRNSLFLILSHHYQTRCFPFMKKVYCTINVFIQRFSVHSQNKISLFV